MSIVYKCFNVFGRVRGVETLLARVHFRDESVARQAAASVRGGWYVLSTAAQQPGILTVEQIISHGEEIPERLPTKLEVGTKLATDIPVVVVPTVIVSPWVS